MKFATIVLALTIASANSKTRRLNTIVDESDVTDASMSMLASSLYAAKGGGSSSSKSSKSPTRSPTPAPPEVSNISVMLFVWNNNNDDNKTYLYSYLTTTAW